MRSDDPSTAYRFVDRQTSRGTNMKFQTCTIRGLEASMATERVYAVWEYYDGIRSGVADFRGEPHYFEQPWSEQLDDYLPTFLLKAISQSTLIEVLEQAQIFRDWEAAFHRGEVEQDTHPGLPGQNPRYAELEATLKAKLAEPDLVCKHAQGLFSVLPDQAPRPLGVLREVQVEWQDAT
jgi:hypothetical protein